MSSRRSIALAAAAACLASAACVMQTPNEQDLRTRAPGSYTGQAFNYYLVGETTISGDYNNNGTVDAADYVVWRKNPGGFPAAYRFAAVAALPGGEVLVTGGYSDSNENTAGIWRFEGL